MNWVSRHDGQSHFSGNYAIHRQVQHYSLWITTAKKHGIIGRYPSLVSAKTAAELYAAQQKEPA